MNATDALAKNLQFCHWLPRYLMQDLTHEQLHWQPDDHDNTIGFAIAHAFRTNDDLLHRLLIDGPTFFEAQGWAGRLPGTESGERAFGQGYTREHVAAVEVDPAAIGDYAEALGAYLTGWLDARTPEDLLAPSELPRWKDFYEPFAVTATIDRFAFLAVGHTMQHLGEVQMLRGRLGLKGGPF